jgi:hypothetical protein
MERGIAFATYENELFDHLVSGYLGRDPCSIGEADVISLESPLSAWFADRAATRTVFIPCAISPWPSPRFSVGPINFIFIDDVATSEYSSMANVSWDRALDKLLVEMRKERVHWLAVVEVQDCDLDRGQEVTELAVDLGIVAVQLAAPYLGTTNMSRLAARRGPGIKLTLSIAGDETTGGWSRLEPGMSIGKDYLGQIVRDTAPLITAVGHRVRSFTTGSFRLPKLEQAWCDAAYWLHERLAEKSRSDACSGDSPGD